MPVAADTPFSDDQQEAILSLRPSHHASAAGAGGSNIAASAASSSVAAESSPAQSSRATTFPPHGTPFRVGAHTHLTVGHDLLEMPDSSSLYRTGNVTGLMERLERDGYVLLRGFLPRSKALEARRCVCEAMSRDWKKIDLSEQSKYDDDATENAATSDNDPFTATALLRARITAPSTASSTSSSSSSGSSGLILTGFRGVTHDRRTMDLLEGEELATLFSRIFTEAARSSKSPHASFSTPVAPATFDTKWVRVHGHGEFTDEHTDYYRFEHWETRDAAEQGPEQQQPEEDGARGMYTCWIPLGSYPLAHGTLVVAEGTHRLSGYAAGVYDPDSRRELPPDFENWRDGTGAHSADGPGIWRSAEVRPGDAIVFDLRLIHASTHNTTDRFRISMDTRWKPSAQLLEGQKEAFRDLADRVR